MKLSLKEHVNMVLFQADLLNTSCVANEANDEYKRIAEQLNNCIVYNDHTICEEMLEDIFRVSLALDDDESLSDYVSQAEFYRVINDLKEHLITNFPK